MSPRRNRYSPTPSLASKCAPPPEPKGGGHTRLQVRGWGSPNSDDWRKAQHSVENTKQDKLYSMSFLVFTQYQCPLTPLSSVHPYVFNMQHDLSHSTCTVHHVPQFRAFESHIYSSVSFKCQNIQKILMNFHQIPSKFLPYEMKISSGVFKSVYPAIPPHCK